jgi:DNA-binding beta-propeller fold protein YncE
MDVQRGLLFPYAGSGREARVDGAADEAAFAQPTGLTITDRRLYVADAESNIIRAIALPPDNRVRTIAGGDLFDFGYVDGRGDRARFQHPLGITAIGRTLYVADTYNHRIRTVDAATGEVGTLAGSGVEGAADAIGLAAEFYEPGGISATTDGVYVADTNNHAIRRLSLSTGMVETLEIA